jgi:predicted acyl esterase
LTLPKNTSTNFPIVILASGSGPQNRDCELLGHKPFAVIAEHFAAKGIATLRFDDRGTGKSTGSFQTATLKDIASDVNACVEFLSKYASLKGHPIGIAGHSEGGMHALMVARKNKKVHFLLQLASIGTDGYSTLVEQQYLIPLKEGFTEEEAQWNKNLYAACAEIVMNNNKEQANDVISELLDSLWPSGPDKLKKESNVLYTKLSMNMLLNNVWGREFLAFRSADYLKKIKVPILAINGGKDIQVPPSINKEGFDRNFSKKSRPSSLAIIVPGKNHLFQTCQTCSATEYKELDHTFSEDVLTIMSDWILKTNQPSKK